MIATSATDSAVRPPRPARWTPIALLAGGMLGFLATAADLLYHGQLAQWDRPLQVYFHEHSAPSLVLLFSAISGMGELLVIVGVAVVVAGALAARKKWRSLAIWALALCGSGIINPVLKNWFQVPRPGTFTFYVFKTYSGYSFPSGHTMAVCITAGALALVWLHEVSSSRPRRWTAGAVVAGVSLLEAFALLYIGVHYLTDVVSGLAVSAAWLGVIRWMLPPR